MLSVADLFKGSHFDREIIISVSAGIFGSVQVVPGGLAGFVASRMHEFGFQSAKTAFHRCIVPQAGCRRRQRLFPAGIQEPGPTAAQDRA